MTNEYTQHETEFGTVIVQENVVSVSADNAQLRAWAERPGALWPCSTLRRFDTICAFFSDSGLIDLQGWDGDREESEYIDDSPAAYDTSDIAGDELSAWASDCLRDILPREHPAYFATVGQLDEWRRR